METKATISRPESRSGRYSQGGTTREQRCSELAMTGAASDRRNERSKAIAKAELRVGRIIEADNIQALGDK